MPTHPGNDPTSPTLRQMETLAIAEDERVLRETSAGGASMDLAYANAKVPSLANVKSHADDLDDYLERLYDDDMNTRVSATAHIAALGEPAGVARARHAGADAGEGVAGGRA